MHAQKHRQGREFCEGPARSGLGGKLLILVHKLVENRLYLWITCTSRWLRHLQLPDRSPVQPLPAQPALAVALRAAAMNCWINSELLIPGADSTPLETSTPYGSSALMAAATLEGLRPPASTMRG